jgi:hypothetical protein
VWSHPSEVEIAIMKRKNCKLPGSDQIQAEGEMLFNSIWIKEELPNQWKEPIVLLIH